MSHKFHGKGSGKKKTEKRMKRVWDEFVSASACLRMYVHLCVGGGGGGGGMHPVSNTTCRPGALHPLQDLKKADTQDTPLGTLGLMQDKQKQTSLPYVVLTGQQSAPHGA